MKASEQSTLNHSTCSLFPKEPAWALRITPGLLFNARAVRARAGLLNTLIAGSIALMLMNPEGKGVLYIMSFLLVEMVAAVLFGLRNSPLGIIATLLTHAFDPQWTPHLPKRFAWTLGSLLAGTCLFLQLAGVQQGWIIMLLGVFFILTWLDAVLGFCVGCWIYSKLYGCRTCNVG
jgi:hypothetical protein